MPIAAHLELGVLLQAIGVLAISAVVRPHRWLDIAHTPLLWAEDPQKRGRIHGSRPHLSHDSTDTEQHVDKKVPLALGGKGQGSCIHVPC